MGVQNDHVQYSFIDNRLRSLVDLYEWAHKFAKVKSLEILPKPSSMRHSTRRSNSRDKCTFYDDVRHKTEDCFTLKDAIEEVVRNDELVSLLIRVFPNRARVREAILRINRRLGEGTPQGCHVYLFTQEATSKEEVEDYPMAYKGINDYSGKKSLQNYNGKLREVVIPVEICMHSHRTTYFDENANQKAMKLNLNLIDEVKEVLKIKNTTHSQQVVYYYNYKVKNKQFQVDDLILRNTEAILLALQQRKMAPRWREHIKL
ncbi:hypothetical protein J1N35_044030 [Gossypium stocksii]|uniref:Uncharacterized protein n=1 Tax=Gossypium stocksii TaxID=47602 RepID=A0A9D3U873_9ROSI|nr:hypothetical protein J1N35_044030 [Gossypium stocksii]